MQEVVKAGATLWIFHMVIFVYADADLALAELQQPLWAVAEVQGQQLCVL